MHLAYKWLDQLGIKQDKVVIIREEDKSYGTLSSAVDKRVVFMWKEPVIMPQCTFCA